jgi:hypothetical protein
MSMHARSTQTQVREPQKVREVLDSYILRLIGSKIYEESDGWFLELWYRDKHSFDAGEPLAVRRDLLPRGKKIRKAALENLIQEEGEAGFISLLRELIPFLVTPLMVLSVSYSESSMYALAWLVLPGAEDVKTLAVSPD